MSVCLSVCLSLTSASSETVEVIIVPIDKVIASDMGIHHVLIIMTLTSIQGHTNLNHEINTSLMISETIQAVPIRFAVQIVRLQVFYDHCQSDDLDLRSRSQVRLKRDYLLPCKI